MKRLQTTVRHCTLLNSFLWIIFSLSVPAVQHHRREKDSTTLKLSVQFLLLPAVDVPCWILFAQFLNFSRKFKVSIASLISLKSSSSEWVSSGIGESSKVHLVADLSERERSQRDPFNFSSSPFSDVTRTIYVWSTLPLVWLSVDFKGKGASDRIDGARKTYTSTTGANLGLLQCSVAFLI